MKALLILAEYLAGFLVMLVTLLCLAGGGIFGLFEVPGYLRRRWM